MVSMSIVGTAHANRKHVTAIHNGCVTSKSNGTVGKNGTIWRPISYLSGQLTQKRDDPVKNGTSGHRSPVQSTNQGTLC
jgi:hypothetical protein